MRRSTFLVATLAAFMSCSKSRVETPTATAPTERPSILLITLDTTRYDSIGPGAKDVETPSYNALVKRGLRFHYAYAAVPQTLPSHISMLTGLYPAGHGVHENSRYLGAQQPLVSEKLHAAGYRTGAFVSAFAVARRFGLGRGFDIYDEDFGDDKAERPANETTDR
ncbi:MAG: sulfatase-like hydrolase/transferase, partial [Thermoanaerobaculia bacterium]